ncbi:MAG: hypothetical protein ABIF71_10315 [Planctomycetota bacterium]
MKTRLLVATLLACLAPLAYAGVKAGPEWTGSFTAMPWYVNNLDRDSGAADAANWWRGDFRLETKVYLEDSIDLVAVMKFEQAYGSGLFNVVDSDGDSEADVMAVHEAYARFNNFLWPWITVAVGRMEDRYALQDNMGALMFDTNLLTPSRGADGLKVTVDLDNITGNFFMYTYGETAGIGGIAGDDAVIGAQMTYDFNVENTRRIFGMLLLDQRGAHSTTDTFNNLVGTSVLSINAGATWDLMPGLLVYGQFAVNTGYHCIDPTTLDDSDERLTASGLAYQVGAEWQIPDKAASVWLQYDSTSGDDADTTDKYEGFLAPAESIDLLLIVESEYLYNRSQNLSAIRLGGSYTMGEVELSAALGMYSENKKELADGLGTEIDFKAQWEYSDNVLFSGIIAYYMPDGDYATDDAALAVSGKVSVAF